MLTTRLNHTTECLKLDAPYLEVLHESCQMCQALTSTATHTNKQGMAAWLLQNTADAGNMLQRKAEQHKVQRLLATYRTQ